MNTIGLIICLIGITIHVFLKARQEAENIKLNSREPVPVKSRRTRFNSTMIYTKLDEDNDDSDTDSFLSKSLKNKNLRNSESFMMTHQNKPLLSDSS